MSATESGQVRDGPATAETLVREILKRLADVSVPCDNGPRSAGTAGTVVFEVLVDGVSYALVRCEPQDDDLDHLPHVALSPREQEIVRLVAKGLRTRPSPMCST